MEKQVLNCALLEVILLCHCGSSAVSQTPSEAAAPASPNPVLTNNTPAGRSVSTQVREKDHSDP